MGLSLEATGTPQEEDALDEPLGLMPLFAGLLLDSIVEFVVPPSHISACTWLMAVSSSARSSFNTVNSLYVAFHYSILSFHVECTTKVMAQDCTARQKGNRTRNVSFASTRDPQNKRDDQNRLFARTFNPRSRFLRGRLPSAALPSTLYSRGL